MLIKCPECGKEISSYAALCLNCGIPMEEIKKMLEEDRDADFSPNFENLLICIKCGHFSAMPADRTKRCPTCGERLVETKYKRTEFLQQIQTDNFKYAEQIKRSVLAEYVDLKEVEENAKKIGEEYREQVQAESLKPIGSPDRNIEQNIPTCPTCKSKDIRKVSLGAKAGSVAVFGALAAGKVSKTWHCNNCGAEW